MLRRLYIVLTCLALVSCGEDPVDSGTPDAGDAADSADTADSGADVPVVECADTPVPNDGEQCECEGDDWQGEVGLCQRNCLCEFAFWTCTEECDEPEAMTLEFASEPSVDEQTGNGDAIINPGEVWLIAGSIRANNAPEGGADSTVRLTSTSIHINVDGADSAIDGLTDEPVEFSLPFSVSESAPPGRATVTLEGFSGFESIEDAIEFQVVASQAAVLEWTRIEVLDDGGAPAVRIQVGDELTVRATLSNSGTVAAEGVAASASPSSASVTSETTANVGILAAGGTRVVEFAVAVSEDPSELAPVVTVAATATNATTATRDQTITIFPPDTIEVLANEWSDLGGGEWELQVDVENTGRFPISGLTWSAINYERAPPCEDPEDPCFESMGFRAPSGPGNLAPGVSAEVTIPVTITEATPEAGRVLLRASSNLRSHGPFALEVDRP